MQRDELRKRLCQLLFFRVPFYESVVDEILTLFDGWKSLEEIQDKPLLGLATTRELFEELMARSDNLDYRTVDDYDGSIVL